MPFSSHPSSTHRSKRRRHHEWDPSTELSGIQEIPKILASDPFDAVSLTLPDQDCDTTPNTLLPTVWDTFFDMGGDAGIFPGSSDHQTSYLPVVDESGFAVDSSGQDDASYTYTDMSTRLDQVGPAVGFDVSQSWLLSPGIPDEQSNLPSSSRQSTQPDTAQSADAGTAKTPTEQEWTDRRPFIKLLYGPDEINLTLAELMKVMETAGFLRGATVDMYKKRFHKWGLIKNESNARRRRQAPRRPGSLFPGGEAKVTVTDMFECIQTICIKSIQQEKWSLKDEFCVIDDDWEEAYGSAAALVLELSKNPQSSSGWETIRDEMAPMVKELSYFSLPTILIIAFKMCDKLKDPANRRTAGDFLHGCQQLARDEAGRSDRHVPLAKLLEGLYTVSQRDMETLTDLLKLIIPSCIHFVNDYANSESATALSLLSFYHVQLKSEPFWLDLTLEKLRQLAERAKAAKGVRDKATVEIMGLTIMVLQETDRDVELRQASRRMRTRITQCLGADGDGLADNGITAYFLGRLLDVIHLEIRLTLKEDTDESVGIIKELVEEYKTLEGKYGKEKDGYCKYLEIELEEVTSQMSRASL